MPTITKKNPLTLDALILLEGLGKIKLQPRKAGGTWATVTLGEFKAEALVFEGHAECEDYELGDSRISKLSIQDGRGAIVASFDRGWDLKPKSVLVKNVVDLLAAGLAETVFG